MKTRVLVPLAALLACLALAAPATAAVTGNFAGETSQDLSSLGLDEPYTTNIVFSILNGRVVTVSAEVRMLCGETSIQDVRVLKSYRTGRGPQIAGGFRFTVQGAEISGNIGKKTGQGAIKASKGGCSGDGKWKVSYVKGT